MTTVDKRVFAPKTTEKLHSFTRFAIGGRAGNGVLVSHDCVHCDCTDGTLRSGIGLRDYALFEGGIFVQGNMPEADEFFAYADGGTERKLGFISTGGTPYYYDDNEGRWVQEESYYTQTKALTAMDKTGAYHTLYIGGSGVFRQTQTGRSFCGFEYALPVACAFMGRVFFALDERTLVYSEAYEPYEFTESLHGGGKIVLSGENGKIVAMLPFEGEVYLFFERGISVLTAGGSPREFALRKMEYHGSKIFARSVTACGNKIFFLTEDGFFTVGKSGLAMTGENLELAHRQPTRVRGKATFNGKYICSFSADDGKNYTVVIDGEKGTGYDTFTVEGLSEYLTSTLCVSNFSVREFCEKGELPTVEAKRKFTFSNAFGSGVKTLKRLSFTGKGKMTLAVSNGRKSKLFSLDLSSGKTSARIGLRGRVFTVSLVLERDTEVESATALTEVLRGVNYDD